ncbi:gamma-glutamyltranspeptidase/glutathione hydrolase [Ureibacillus xyleni]|uniref:Glutathione hydrolase proenzyme n=1 Tax=Ureibacillus xyleni TaxID=614648 RepID=A0A285SSC1_9BACL|nr:gamma-glutamyltransferase [Ureibacillus xyleni]SOC11210.1 gamma-glutamyltranspeptidase/glutathione hydrolase [Ureibacillus xyleni]
MGKQYRATTMSTKGMVTTPHYLASQAALSILQKGGNAIEAAIAAASTIGVVYPHMNGIGGDNFWLIYNAKTKELKALNSSGRSGEKATIEFYKSQGLSKIPSRGAIAANTVPGAVAGWGQAFNYGNNEMESSLSWKSLLESALDYAKNGFPVTPSQTHWTEVNLEASDTEFRALGRFQEFNKVFLKNGKPYQAGEIMKQEDLARTLDLIAENGADYFYNSELTERMVEDLQKHGGILTVNDFKQHTSDWVNPISVKYRQYTAYNLPPNTQGMASLSILNILNHIEMNEIEEGSSTYYHVLVEAIKHAFNDRDRYLTDPEFVNIPVKELLSPQHGLELAEKIKDSERAKELQLLDAKGDTVWFGIVDEYGNAVSMIQSIYHEFGSGFIPKDTGIILQNRGSYFSLDENHVNALAPRKRTFHTLNPAMLLKDGKPALVYGTMGGEGQPQTQAALVTRIVDYRMNVQEAIEAPRWLYGRTWGAASNSLKVENRISQEVCNELKSLGHELEVLEEFTDIMGHAGAIFIDEQTNVKYGGADPRGDGMAIGY